LDRSESKDNRGGTTATGLRVAFLLLFACASGGQRPAGIAAPQIDGYQVGIIFFGSGNTSPVTIEVDITNRAARPIVLRRIDIASPGMSSYTLVRATRDFRETIEPGARKTIPMHATAVTSVASPSEPLSVQIFVEFEADGTRWREVVNEPLIPQR
jgi:hypothetical protein